MTELFVNKSVGVLFVSLFTPVVLFAGPKVSGAISNTDAMSHEISIAINVRRVDALGTEVAARSGVAEKDKAEESQSSPEAEDNTIIQSGDKNVKTTTSTLNVEAGNDYAATDFVKITQGRESAAGLMLNSQKRIRRADISASGWSDIFENRIDGGTGIDFSWRVASSLNDNTFNEAIDITIYENLTGGNDIANMASTSIFNESMDGIIFDGNLEYSLEDGHGAVNLLDLQMLNSIARNSGDTHVLIAGNSIEGQESVKKGGAVKTGPEDKHYRNGRIEVWARES